MDELAYLHDDGVFLRREALALGYRDRDLSAGLRAKVISRVRHGAYVPTPIWTAADAEERHRLRSSAVLLTHGRQVALSHSSAAAHHGLRLWNVDLDRVHVLRLDGGPGRVCGDVVYHAGAWSPDDVWQLGDRLLTSPARAAVETASIASTEAGLVVLDSVLDLDLAGVADLAAAYTSMGGWPFTQHLQVAMRLVRRGAQSVGESRARFLCWHQGLPEPELQFEVRDADGVLLGTTDMAWPEHRLLGEFDGRVKYGRLLRPGESPGDAVFREKKREDRIREATGWLFVRLVWADLYQPRATADRIRALLRRVA